MGRQKRSQKNFTLQHFTKNSRSPALVSLGFIFLAVISCQSNKSASFLESSAKNQGAESKENLLKASTEEPLGVAIVQLGKNSDLRLSQDERKLVYASADRRAHLHSQIYSLDLSNFKERRLTFNDGESRFPFLLENRDLVYSSNTDALKEKPLLFYPNPGFAVSHLYISDTSGNEVRRLSDDFSQEQATGDLLANEQLLILKKGSSGKNSSDNTNLELYQLNIKNQNLQRLGPTDEAWIHVFPFQKMWIKLSKKESSAQVSLSNDLSFKKLTLQMELPIQNMSDFSVFKNLVNKNSMQILIAGNVKIIGSQVISPEAQGIFLFDLQNRCVQQLVNSQQSVSGSQLTQDGKTLFYVSNEKQGGSIFMKALRLEAIPCASF